MDPFLQHALRGSRSSSYSRFPQSGQSPRQLLPASYSEEVPLLQTPGAQPKSKAIVQEHFYAVRPAVHKQRGGLCSSGEKYATYLRTPFPDPAWRRRIHPPAVLSIVLLNRSALDDSSCRVESAGGRSFQLPHWRYCRQADFARI